MKKNFYWLIVILLLFASSVQSQNLQELEQKLSNTQGKEKAELLLQISRKYLNNNNDKALEAANEALKIIDKEKLHPLKSEALELIAYSYYYKKDYSNSVSYFEKELKLIEKTADLERLGKIYYNIASMYQLLDKENRAIEYYRKSLEIAKKMEDASIQLSIYESLFDLYYDKGKYKKSLEYFKMYVNLKDAKILKEKRKEISVLESTLKKEQTEKIKQLKAKDSLITHKDCVIQVTEKENVELKVESAVKDETITQLNYEKAYKETKIQQQKQLIISIIGGLVLILFLLFVIYNRYKIKKKANAILTEKNVLISQQNEEIKTQAEHLREMNEELIQQKEEIIAQRDEIEGQKNIIEQKSKKITSSIEYAKTIQTAVLPHQDIIKQYLPQSFVLYLPKDIVSGDFYFIEEKNNLVFIAVADCTGHGVPGAFVSMLTSNLLYQAINEHNITNPSEILKTVSEQIHKIFQKKPDDTAVKDGMDIALCCYNPQKQNIQFSGAFNPLIIIRNQTIIEHKGDVHPIGRKFNERFTGYSLIDINIEKGDTFYMFSDGFADQFGDSTGSREKYSRQQFKKNLIHINSMPMDEQKNFLLQAHLNWKGSYEQIDDVTVMGFKIL